MPSAVEPTYPGLPSPHDGSHARVIPIRARGRRRTPAGEPAPVTPQQQLAETMQALFLARGRTLTDGPTAEAYDITLGAVLLMLDGAHAEGVVGTAEHMTLRGMVQGMVDAPASL
ncbi:hypothetical protein [Streptomyces sp. NPDC047985]|uniref:hypothetical protein n=1 Tax=Streptomyces sp. NPDC047985 TaxID=3155384 RepID=UPI003436750E